MSAIMFVFIFITDYLIHQKMLAEAYRDTGFLWRTPAEMQKTLPWMIFGQILTAILTCRIFHYGYENKGIGEGVRFGLLLSGLYVATYLINYAVMPIPQSLLWSWTAATVAQGAAGGAVLAILYKRIKV